MEFIERIEISLIKKLNRMTENDFENYYINFSDDIEKIKKKDLKSLYEKIMCFCKVNIKNNGITKRVYNYSIETIKEKGGRLYCGNSIQGFPKSIRGFLDVGEQLAIKEDVFKELKLIKLVLQYS